MTPSWAFKDWSNGANLTLDHGMQLGGTPYTGWSASVDIFGEDGLGQAKAGDDHPDDWKKTEVKVTRKSNTNIVVESKGI